MTNLTTMGKAVSTVFAVIFSFVIQAMGGVDDIMILLTTLIVADYITGVVVAIRQKKLSSETGLLGIAKKITIFILVFVGHRMDVALGTTFLRSMVLFFFISNEGISLLENTTAIGVPYPPKLKEVLAQLKEGGDKS